MAERRLQTAVLVVSQRKNWINSTELSELDLIRISKIGFAVWQKQTIASFVDMHMSLIIIDFVALQLKI